MGSHYKVLIADDSPVFRNLMKDMLKEDLQNTYEPILASNGREACTKAFHELPDIILIDIDMPVMSGISAIKLIKSNKMFKDIPTIVVSSTKLFEESFTAGVDDFLVKPFTKYELLLRIKLNLKLALRNSEIKKQNKLLRIQKQEAINQRDIIIKQKGDLMADLNYARFVQNAILTSPDDFNRIFKNHFTYNRPKYIVSGDFYWVTQKNNLSIAVVGDCTGHGMSGALMTMSGVAFLNEIINTIPHLNADQILNELRTKVIHLLNQKGDIGEASNGMDIALCIYDEANGTLQFAGANNPLYVVHKGKELEIFKGDRLPIGYFFSYDHPFSRQIIKIEKGDTIYMSTDGYADQFGGPFGKKFRYAQFRELMEKAALITSMEEQMDLIKSSMDSWINGYDQVDDMLIIGIRF